MRTLHEPRVPIHLLRESALSIGMELHAAQIRIAGIMKSLNHSLESRIRIA